MKISGRNGTRVASNRNARKTIRITPGPPYGPKRSNIIWVRSIVHSQKEYSNALVLDEGGHIVSGKSLSSFEPLELHDECDLHYLSP